MRKLTSLVLMFIVVLLFSPSAFADESEESGWEFMLSPYLWAPNLETTLGVGEATVPVDLSVSDIFDRLKFAGMLHFNMKKDRWGVFVDYMYVNLGEDGVPVDVPRPLIPQITADYRYKLNMTELAGTFRLAGTRTHGFDAILGLRYMSHNVDLDVLGSGPLEKEFGDSFKETWWDLMLGFRYNAVFSRKWVMAARGDIGFPSSNVTVNILASLGYRFGRTVDMFVAYRYLDINYENDKEGREYFKFDGDFNGFALGLNFRFGKRL